MTTIIDGSAGVTFPNGSNPQAAPSKVLQVVNASYSTQVSTSSNSYVDTGLTASITPLFSTSKILVLVSLNGCAKDTNNTSLDTALVRNSTKIAEINFIAAATNSSAFSNIGSQSICFQDSPSTTSSTTYKVQFNSQQNTAIVYVQQYSAVSTITLMEIAQ